MSSARPPVLTVIAPCYNEQDNIQALVERMLATFERMDVPAELVLVDDGSKDATWAQIEAAQASSAQVRGVRHEKNKGIEGAWNSGVQAARGDVVCLIDADLQNRPEDVPRLYRALIDGRADIAQAVRHAKTNAARIVFSKGLNLLLNVTFGMNLRDNKSGFIMCRREVMQELLQHRFRYRYFQSFLGAAAGVRGYRFAEVDTEFDPRTAGVSFLGNLPIKVALTIIVEMAKYRYETIGIRRRA